MQKIAKVLKSNGTDGELLVSFFDIDPEEVDLQEPVFIYMDGLPVPFYFDSLVRRGVNRALVHITGVRNLKDADELSGSDIFADYFEAPEDSDLTGWTVLGADGAPIGPIVGYEDIPGNPCVYVDTQSGERLIPLHPDLVQDMDPDARTVTLQIPEGLL